MRTLDAAAPPLARRSPAAAARVVVVEGDVDALTAARLSAAICSLGVERVVLDLSGVGAIDAAAVRDLVLAARVVGLAVDLVPLSAERRGDSPVGAGRSGRPRP